MKKVVLIGIALALVACQRAVDVPPHTSVSSASSSDGDSFATSSSHVAAAFVPPISRAQERVTKKFFGTHVTPSSSPVQPERFSGYHTGVDFETFPEEQSVDVPIVSACAGTVRFAGRVSGYGGVLIQQCTYEDQPVTVLYGHLNERSLAARVGDDLQAGAPVGLLGKGYSTETDGERKHLHFGIHRGTTENFRGYVSSLDQLNQWIDGAVLLFGKK